MNWITKIVNSLATMTLGKANFIFNRGWGWFSKVSVISNLAMLTYLTFKENTIILWLLPLLLVGWLILTVIDLVIIYPSESQYSFMKVPAFAELVNDVKAIKANMVKE